MYATIDREILAASAEPDAVADHLFVLCDDIGPRFVGTEGYRRAADYMRDQFEHFGLDPVLLEPFSFPAWKRGEPARLTMTAPRERDVPCYTMVYSGATGPAGCEAELVAVADGSAESFSTHETGMKGRLVLCGSGGGPRQEAYIRFVEAGALGVLFANSAPGMILHTGSISHGQMGAIPAVSVAHESAVQLRQWLERGAVRCRLVTDGRCETDTTWNVVGELRGSSFPEERVIMGGHLDSHEIGPGAYDNACGAILVMEVARLLAPHRDALKRTIRFIGFAGEECGLLGSHHHAAAHSAELRKARFMLNCDMPGLGSPPGLAFHGCSQGESYVRRLSDELGTEVGCQNRVHRYSDHYPFVLQGLPTAGVGGGRKGGGLARYVHMAADTAEKIPVPDFGETAAFVARTLLRIANDEDWSVPRRSEEEVQQWRA